MRKGRGGIEKEEREGKGRGGRKRKRGSKRKNGGKKEEGREKEEEEVKGVGG